MGRQMFGMHLHSVHYLASLLSMATAFTGRADVLGRTRQHRYCRALKSEGRFCHRITEWFGLKGTLLVLSVCSIPVFPTGVVFFFLFITTQR